MATRVDVIVREKGGWGVFSEGQPRKRLGGPYPSKGQAVKRLRAVEYFKAHRDAVKRIPRRAPPMKAPARIEEQYAKRLAAIVRGWIRHAYGDLGRKVEGILKAQRERRDEFNPDEPRDESGKWTGGGGIDTIKPGMTVDQFHELFRRVAAAADKFGTLWSKSERVLTDEEKRAAYEWSGSGYRAINAMARTGEDPIYRPMKALDSAIAKTDVPEETTVFRGMDSKFIGDLKPGTVFSDRGYVATSVSSGAAGGFAHFVENTHEGAKAVVVKISLPAGTHVLPVKGQSAGEFELLLGRGSRFQITGSSEVADVKGNKRTVIDAKLLSAERHDNRRFDGAVEHRGQRYVWGIGELTFGRGRTDSPDSHDASKAVAQAAQKLRASVDRKPIAALATKFAERTSTFQRLQLHDQVHETLGIDPDRIKDPDLSDRIDDFARANVNLITSIPEDLHEDVEALVTDAVRRGRTSESFRKDLEDRFDISERRARLIARDQIGKLHADINHTRQRALGVSRGIWRTVGDERVRGDPDGKYPKAEPSHFDLEGLVFSYDDPPVPEGATGPLLPGQDYSCRCWSEPVLDDVLGSEDDEDEDTDAEDVDEGDIIDEEDLDDDTDDDEEQEDLEDGE